jgi:hypothetical protein
MHLPPPDATRSGAATNWLTISRESLARNFESALCLLTVPSAVSPSAPRAS